MKKYKSIYHFEITEKVSEGKTVYYLDRKLHDCGIINNIKVEELTVILKEHKEESTRFDFWIEEETEEKEIEE